MPLHDRMQPTRIIRITLITKRGTVACVTATCEPP